MLSTPATCGFAEGTVMADLAHMLPGAGRERAEPRVTSNADMIVALVRPEEPAPGEPAVNVPENAVPVRDHGARGDREQRAVEVRHGYAW
jgi:hypothetical protein